MSHHPTKTGAECDAAMRPARRRGPAGGPPRHGLRTRARQSGARLGLVIVSLTLAATAGRAGESAPSSAPGTLARSHWSFQPVRNVTVPGRPGEHPIDAFVRARLAEARLRPAPEADRQTLVRRLHLDLLGLPPTPADVRAFCDDRRPDAYARLVDRLLASPHFGERWGRHWLDLARYADSDGYEKDTPRPHAYLFRDWVIDAINRDLPFDQFTIEQLAGDLLPGASDAQRVATGFHRQTLINKEGGVDQEEFRCKATVDRTHTTGAVWLGLTVGCAECHPHKYDPISQREFFELYAFFNNASDADLPLPTPEDRRRLDEARAKWEARRRELEQRLARLEQPADDRVATNTNAIAKARQDLAQHRKAEPAFKGPTAMVLTAATRPTHVHVRGDFLQKGELVAPRTPAFLPPLTARAEVPDRLDLARWLMAPENPLTARVAVNQLWRHLFGRGLVATENDFGSRGEPPSHPELLDWLALEYPRLGWSRKALLRRIVTSAAYRQSSAWREDVAERDPLNRLLARQGRFRLEAEVIRDVALSAGGLLNPRVGGPSFKPVLPRDLANLSYANGLKWEAAGGDERFRRGLYIHFQRTVPYPMLMSFDAPESTVTCTRRERSNSPLQALTLLNNELFVDCAQGLARRLIAVPPSDAGDAVDARIRLGFETVTGRRPTAPEQSRLRQFWRSQRALFAGDAKAARAATGPWPAEQGPGAEARAQGAMVEEATAVALARVLLNLDEAVTRE